MGDAPRGVGMLDQLRQVRTDASVGHLAARKTPWLRDLTVATMSLDELSALLQLRHAIALRVYGAGASN
jgi:hypothetical protein